MIRTPKVLFSSAGRRVQLIDCFRDAARQLGIPLTVLAADSNPSMSAACQIADRSFSVPRCTDPDFIPELHRICMAEQVSLLIPTIDTELEVLSLHERSFAAAGTIVSISSTDVVRTCRNKLETSRWLDRLGIVTPRTGTPAEVLRDPSDWRFPLMLKPIDGSSSIGLAVVRSADDLRSHEDSAASHIVQELWKGAEYTVNLFFNESGLNCAIPHWRAETRAGEVSKGRTQRIPILLEAARSIGAAWKSQAFGALCFQAIVNARGEAAVFEINARFGGGYPLAHQAGATFAQWLLEIVSGRPSSAHDNWRENVLMLRYDAAVFRDQAAP